MMMGEIQGVSNYHVKVDNWPLFFLQRLHHFYRKKVHCDLTLLFPSLDSVKTVKVHKLVLHACTDYFESLDIKKDSEHGEVMVLSNEMHPDVMIPIITFMYTGKLEFPVNLQPKLYEAASKLRMTILMKLLDVQPEKGGNAYIRKETGIQDINTVEISPRSSDASSPILIDETPRITLKSVSAILQKQLDPDISFVNVSPSSSPSPNPNPNPNPNPPLVITPLCSTIKPKVVRKTISSPLSAIAKSKTFENSLPPTLPGRKLPVWTRKIPSSPLVENTQNMKDYAEIPPRPTRFEWDEDLTDPTSIKPVEEATKVLSHDQPVKISQPIILENTALESGETDESLRRTSFSDGSSSESPPYKRFRSDLQDMKEYGKQQQLRNEIICSEENMDDLENMDADDLYGTCEDDDLDDPDDPDDPDDSSSFSPFNANYSTPKPILKTVSKPDPQVSSKRVRFSLEGKENNQQQNTSSGGSGDFTALKESEPDVTSPKIVVPVSQIQDGKQHVKIVSEVLKKYPNLAKKDNIKLRVVSKNPGVPVTVHRAAEGEAGAANAPTVSYIFLTNRTSGDMITPKTADVIAKEKLFDVENITGPWFCRVCNGSRPIQFDSYYSYRRHLVQVHELRIDARICEYCGLKNSKRNLLLYHMYTKHGIDPPPNISFPKCNECEYIALSDTLLAKHKSNHDPLELTCYTCNVVFKSYSSIQMHMKSIWHKSKINKGSLSDYPCPFCNVTFENGNELKEHIETSHHSQMVAAKLKKQMYRCPYCEVIYNDGDKLGKHIVSKHWGKKTQVCNQETKAEANVEQSGQQLEVSAEAEEEPSEVETVETQPSSESESLTNVASGIATSLGLQNDQAVVFYEQRSEDQKLGRETTAVAENECKEFIVINPIEVPPESRLSREMDTDELEAIRIVNEDSDSRLSNAEANSSSCPDHDYSEAQMVDVTRQEIISVQEVDSSASSVIEKLLPDQGLVFANEGDVVFDSSCVGLPQSVILTSGNIVLPEGSSPQEGVILSQVLPQTRIILTSPGILQQSGSIIEKGSTLVFASSENGESVDGVETVEYTAQSSEVPKDGEAEKQEVILLGSCELESEISETVSEKKDEGEHIEVEKKTAEKNEEVDSKKGQELKEVSQSVIKTVGETPKTKEDVEGEKTSETKEPDIIVDDNSTGQSPSETMEVVEVQDGKKANEKEKTTENTSDGEKEEKTVKKLTETNLNETKKQEEPKPKAAEEKKKDEMKPKATEENKKEEETGIVEKKKEEEKTRIIEKNKKKKEGEEMRIIEKKKKKKKREEEGTRILKKKKREEEGTRILEKKKREEEGTKILEKKKREEEGTKILEKKKREEEGTRILEKKKKKKKREEEGMRILEKKKEEEVTRILEKKKKMNEEEEVTRILEKKKKMNEEEEVTRILEKKKKMNEEEEETRKAEQEKEKEKETKTPEKNEEEEKKPAGHRVETSRIVEDWDESNDSQPNIERRSDGPSRPDFF